MLVDYAFPPHPPTAALSAAGATAVSRYLSYQTPATLPKILTPAEYTTLRGAGLSVILNWEYDAHDLVNSGFDAAGAAEEALRQADALPYPDFRVIYFSADWDVTAGQWATIAGRLRTIGGIIGPARVGLYAPYDALGWAKRDGVAAWFWQAGMSTSWSGGRNAQLWPGAHLRQRRTATIGGADCDINDIVQPDYGQPGGHMALRDDPDGVWMLNRVQAIAQMEPPLFGPEEGQDLAFLKWARQVAADAAKAAAATGQPVTQDQVDAAVLKALQDPTVTGAIADRLGGKLDQLLTKLTAVGHALDSPGTGT